MNILIITKYYQSNSAARAIQMRRIVDALINYSDHNITLITEGRIEMDENNCKLETIYIQPSLSKFQFFEKVINRLVCNLFCIRRNKFMLEGLSAAERVIKIKNIDLLLTVSVPFDSHLIGLEIKRKFAKLKWIAFFSDIWPAFLLPEPHRRIKILSNLELGLMRNIVEQCDGFLTPSKYSLDLIRQHFKTNAKLGDAPHCLNMKSLKIENQLGCYIVHSGFLQKERIREALVEAINELGTENKEFKGLIHIGAYDPTLEIIIKKHNCKNIKLLGHVPEDLANKIQSLFETGLIIEAPMEPVSPFLPSKITDSILLNKKLIAITPSKSFIRDFANQHEGINCCEYEKNQIKNCILKTLNSTIMISDEAINHFHPSNVIKMYNSFFNSLG
jgi:glycosyltransferase involved in cell wall biosynthesis